MVGFAYEIAMVTRRQARKKMESRNMVRERMDRVSGKERGPIEENKVSSLVLAMFGPALR